MQELLRPEVILPLLVQIALAGTAFWYALETRKYRIQGEHQLSTMQKQHFLTVAPFLLVGAVPKSILENEIEHHPEKFVRPGSNVDLKEIQKQVRADLINKPDFFACGIQNPTSKLARQVEAMLYSAQNKHFIEGIHSKEVLSEKASDVLILASNPMNQQEAIESMRKSYPGIDKINSDLLPHDKKSYVVVFYRDIEGAVYAVKRPYRIDDDGDIGFSTSTFIILSS